ncbi:hypothetical protein K461DRAFT_271654 [Myriangium duriaei CBS 260.36]|uniref:Uncharacterized protein n=1 Tax=Myriangium duriaei CBS 260.36 TaxID=1168546 RepID=A0A9P4IYJ0_9PEZI|nr:hypothetical protein K461DRAFT_271654 [Myriangium duriaei CBS 260.36]
MAVPADKEAQLAAWLSHVVGGPSVQVSNGIVPQPPVIAIDSGYTDPQAIETYNALKDVQSIFELYIGLLTIQSGTSYDITKSDQAIMAFESQARFAQQALYGPLQMIFNANSGSKQNFYQVVNRSDLHRTFLSAVFERFGFEQAVIGRLDAVLTSYVKSLQAIPIGVQGSKTVDFALRVSRVARQNISGDDSNPIFVYNPMSTLIVLQIKTDSYTKAITKGSDDKCILSMDITTQEMQLNLRIFREMKPRFEQLFSLTTHSSLAEYSQALNQRVDIQSN